jgi:intracellular protein transport protein USO1
MQNPLRSFGTNDFFLVEALLLLAALTPASPDLQKLVAFENAFDRIFKIIELEGSLTNGGVIVQDCLSLMANLLRLNASNQSFFRETGGLPKVAAILGQTLKDEATPDAVGEWNVAQRDKNLWGFMSIIRLFLLGGQVSTQMNQSTFWQNGVVFQMLEIGFHPTLATPIRSEVWSSSPIS